MKRLLLSGLVLLCTYLSQAQLLTWTPPFPTENNPSQTLVITVDASKGNRGLLNHTPTTDVYVHIGVITNYSTHEKDWKHSRFEWGRELPAAQATYLGNNKWSFTISGSLRSFFGITDANESIRKIALLFRNGTGGKKQTNTDASTDMYIPVYGSGLAVRIDQPARQPLYVPVPESRPWAIGDNIPITVNASQNADLKIFFNGTQVAAQSGVQTLSYTASLTAMGNQQIIAEAVNGSETRRDTLSFFVGVSPVAELPAGLKDGINYESDPTAVTLVLHAPNKNLVSLLGDFNNWTESVNYLMNKTPDGKKFWIRLTGLTPGTEYAFQYKVDDSIRIADPYAEKILDAGNDPFITDATYPNLKDYPVGKTSGIISVLQTAAPVYTWGTTNFAAPDKRNLVIYELLLRDFLAAHDWKTLKDSIAYFKRLGVNAIELMPVNEFEGNISWGYNGFQYFAPDKYYGPKNSLKEFIDSCHKNGIAVIMDIVMNHTYGPSPLRDLYYNSRTNRPAADNPWYNEVQPHAFGFGDDFNHERQETKDFFNRVLQHWITEYKMDGFRFDFSKGMTQRPSTDDGSFSQHDPSRVAIINSYVNTIRAADPDAYVILEHFTDNAEETILANNGILLWSRVWGNYQEASMGYVQNSNLEGAVHTSRGWTNPHLVGFMESHDEERITFKNIRYGNSSGNYNIKDTAIALLRMELNAVFLLTLPGPKMIWQFGELGYDYSRCYLSSNGEGGDCDRKLDPKPIRWDYQQDPRRAHVFDVYSRLNRLRQHPLYKDAFMSNRVEYNLANAFKWIKITTDTSNVVVVGNFGVTPTTGTVTFPTAGTWYEYFTNSLLDAAGNTKNFTLGPGEFHVYVNRNLNNATVTPVSSVPWRGTAMEVTAFPNPVPAGLVVKLNLPQGSAVQMELLNMQGQVIRTMHQGFLPSGSHQVSFNRNEIPFPAGTYVLRVAARNAVKTLKVTIQ